MATNNLTLIPNETPDDQLGTESSQEASQSIFINVNHFKKKRRIVHQKYSLDFTEDLHLNNSCSEKLLSVESDKCLQSSNAFDDSESSQEASQSIFQEDYSLTFTEEVPDLIPGTPPPEHAQRLILGISRSPKRCPFNMDHCQCILEAEEIFDDY